MRPRSAPERFHGGNRRLGDAAERTSPSGVRRAHDPGFRVREQQRTTVGRQDADDRAREFWSPRRRPWPARSLGVSLSTLDRRSAVHLMNGLHVVGEAAEMARHEGPVLGHGHAVVGRALSAVEARIEAARRAALAREEAMADARQERKVVGFEGCQHGL